MTASVDDRDESMQGHYAGAVTRFGAFAVDAVASTGFYLLLLAGIHCSLELVTGRTVTFVDHRVATGFGYAVWEFLHFAYSWASGGRTLGMAIVGLRVVRTDGVRIGGRRAVIGTLALPLSFLFFGLGFIGILVQRERRALHDLIAGTVVVYDWDARAASLRLRARLHHEPPAPARAA